MDLIFLSSDNFDYLMNSRKELRRSRDKMVEKYRVLSSQHEELLKDLESEKEHVVELEEELHQNALELQHFKELCELYSKLIERCCDKRDVRF